MTRAGLLAMLAALALAGCGRAPPKVVVPVQKYVLTSIAECVEIAGAKEGDCGTAFDTAITKHAQASAYSSMRLCEKEEGPDRCEKLEETVWLPKPQGFLVLRQGDTTQSQVLYAVKGNVPQYRGADQTVYDPDNPQQIKFSSSALRRADAFAARR